MSAEFFAIARIRVSFQKPLPEQTPRRNPHPASRHCSQIPSETDHPRQPPSSIRPLSSAGCMQSPAYTPSLDDPSDFPSLAQSTSCDFPESMTRMQDRQNRKRSADPASFLPRNPVDPSPSGFGRGNQTAMPSPQRRREAALSSH